MIDLRPVLFINGFLLLILAAAMVVPASLDLLHDTHHWPVFLSSAGLTAFAGCAMLLSARPPAGRVRLTTRQAFFLTVSSWLLVVSFGALPFATSGLHLSYTDAFFETMSGLTTTGATVITGLDHLPKPLLLWRALLNWLGGIGFIIMSVSILPVLRIGGMQMFHMETSDKNDKVQARVSQLAGGVAWVYALLTLAFAVAFWLVGMTPFEALCHAMSSLSTGGFSTADQSFAHFGSGARWVAVAAMVMGGATFTLYVAPWKRGRWAIVRDSQVRWYLAVMASFAGLVGLWRWATTDFGVVDSFEHAVFNVVSVVTTTGFVSADYDSWGGFAQVTFFILTFIGGCTGSAAGAIKVFRYEVLFGMAGAHLKRLLHPHGVFPISFNRQPLAEAVARSVLGFIIMYFFTFAGLALGLTVAGLDMTTSLSGAAAALGNVGHGLGPVIGPAGTFKPLPESAKWLLDAGMLLGRLELATVIAMTLPSFWRD